MDASAAAVSFWYGVLVVAHKLGELCVAVLRLLLVLLQQHYRPE